MGPELAERPEGRPCGPTPIQGLILAAVVAAAMWGTFRVAWWAGTIDYDVRYRAERIEKADQIEKRLDGIDAKLDIVIRRAKPKTKGE